MFGTCCWPSVSGCWRPGAGTGRVRAHGRDERVELDGYAGQNPDDVARQLGDAALMFANDLVRVSPTDWDRTVIYTYPYRAERSLRWLAVHTVHEVRHHLLDVRLQISGEAARGNGR